MRILFKKEKQKELILDYKLKNDLTWKEFANKLSTNLGALKGYYYETSLLPESLYLILDKENKYKEHILEKRQDFWGQKIGGSISIGSTKKISLPSKSSNLAEFYGIMLGDGNLTSLKSYKVGTYMLRIVGDSRYDKAYLLNFVKPLIENLFSISVKTGMFKGKNAYFIEAHSKNLVLFFEKLGFKPGNKIKNNLSIPIWIKQDLEFLRVCIRGLFDTDGSFYRLGNQNSYQISFKSHNPILLNDVRDGLIKLGINPSKIMSNRSIVITKKEEITKFYKSIGFSNPKHLNKIKALIAPSSSGQIS